MDRLAFRALVVDDDELDRNSLVKCIHGAADWAEQSIDVKQASDLSTMYQKLAISAYDVLFLDIKFGTDLTAGLREVRVIRGAYPKLPIVLVTAHYVARVPEAVEDYWGDSRICGFLDKGNYTREQIYYAIEKAREWSIEVPDKAFPSTVEGGQALQVLKRTLSPLLQNMDLTDAAFSDLTIILSEDKAAYGAIVRALIALNTSTGSPTQGARSLEGIASAVWEKRATDHYRIYFEVTHQAQVMRVTHKNEQARTIDWLKAYRNRCLRAVAGNRP